MVTTANSGGLGAPCSPCGLPQAGEDRMGTPSCLVVGMVPQAGSKGAGRWEGLPHCKIILRHRPDQQRPTSPRPGLGGGTYGALVGLGPLLALQTCRELLVRAVGHLLHQLQPLLHLRMDRAVGGARSTVGSWVMGQDGPSFCGDDTQGWGSGVGAGNHAR